VHQPGQLWRGRRVRVVDGTGITLPDTPLNQALPVTHIYSFRREPVA
jgi:hypothetical protein